MDRERNTGMEIALWVLQVGVFWLVTVPLLTLVHELGHALAGLITTRGWVTAAIGTGGDPRTIGLGRLKIELRPFSGIVGSCHREYRSGSGRGEALFYGAGPLLSLVSAAILGYLRTSATGNSTLAQMLTLGNYAALLQLIAMLVPVRYPSWLGAYAGYLSDGAMRRDDPPVPPGRVSGEPGVTY